MKVFKPSSRTKTPAPLKSSASTIHEESSPPPHASLDPRSPTTTKRFTSRSGSPVFVRRASITSTANSGRRSPSVLSVASDDYTSRSARPEPPRSVPTDTPSKQKQDSSDVFGNAGLTPTQIFKSRGRRTSNTGSKSPSTTGESRVDAQGLPSRALDSLQSGLESAASQFQTPAELIKLFAEKGNPEMSKFVAALSQEEKQDNNQISDKTDETKLEQNDNSEVMSSEETGSSEAPKSKPVRRPGIPKAGTQEDGSQFFDNMGRPARIERSVDIEIPVKKAEKETAAPNSTKPQEEHTSNEKQTRPQEDFDKLGRIEDLASTGDLKSTEHLASTDNLEDPPEEFLDPNIHSPASSAVVTPIPRIGRISPLQSPSQGTQGTQGTTINISDLTESLQGYAIDDVGNVVSESGQVLGYVIGDLPSMVGKKVGQDGKVYDEEGEVLGHVTEIFKNKATEGDTDNENDDEHDDDDDDEEEDDEDESDAQEEDDLTDALNGLLVDRDGNILDSRGNVVGRLNQPPAQTAQPNGQRPRKQARFQKDDEKSGQQKKNRSPAVPADICLDVKSTYDGIQIILKIPTMFDKAPKTITIT